jgi:uncharacterized protein (TIGR03435 family)
MTPAHKFLSAAILLSPAIGAQPVAGRPEFEVASVKPAPPDRMGFGIKTLPGGGLQARNITLKRLIATAYSVTDYQIFGETHLIESKYDVDARAGGPADLAQIRLMVQSLLDERFKLKFHREAREQPIYTLVVVKPGAPGLIAKPDIDCSAAVTPQDAPPTKSSLPSTPCGTVNLGLGRIFGQRGRISQLADRLSTFLGRTVVDKTGLQGTFNIELQFTPDADMLPPGAPAPDPSGPSLFTALQEQLGLKLQAGKGPVEVIVVDSAEKPAGN